MHDWSTMRKTWTSTRDGAKYKVPKGAVSGVSIGDAIDKVAAMQKKGGLKPLIAELTKLDGKLKTYKAAITKKHKPFADWIGQNIEKWVADDKQACQSEINHLVAAEAEIDKTIALMLIKPFNAPLFAVKQSCLTARGLDVMSQNVPINPDEIPKLQGVFAVVTNGLDAVAKICRSSAQGIAAANPAKPPIVDALSAAAEDSTRARDVVLGIALQGDWDYATGMAFKAADSHVTGYQYGLGELSKAVKARIG